MKIGHMIAIAAACGFLGVAGAQAAEQASTQDQKVMTSRSAYRNHHPAVVIHRHQHPHHLRYSQPHLRHHHHPVVR